MYNAANLKIEVSIGAKSTVNQQQFAEGIVTVHGAVVLFSAKLLLCDV